MLKYIINISKLKRRMEFVWKMGKLLYNVGPSFIPPPTPVVLFTKLGFLVVISIIHNIRYGYKDYCLKM
jgi:hypothetical protein